MDLNKIYNSDCIKFMANYVKYANERIDKAKAQRRLKL